MQVAGQPCGLRDVTEREGRRLPPRAGGVSRNPRRESVSRPARRAGRHSRKERAMLITILVIVLIVLALGGYFGRGRYGRR
jgi:hypothetical protein